MTMTHRDGAGQTRLEGSRTPARQNGKRSRLAPPLGSPARTGVAVGGSGAAARRRSGARLSLSLYLFECLAHAQLTSLTREHETSRHLSFTFGVASAAQAYTLIERSGMSHERQQGTANTVTDHTTQYRSPCTPVAARRFYAVSLIARYTVRYFTDTHFTEIDVPRGAPRRAAARARETSAGRDPARRQTSDETFINVCSGFRMFQVLRLLCYLPCSESVQTVVCFRLSVPSLPPHARLRSPDPQPAVEARRGRRCSRGGVRLAIRRAETACWL